MPPLLTFTLPANATIALVLATLVRQLRLPAHVARLLRLTRLGGQTVPANTSIGALAGPPMRNAFGQSVVQPITLEIRTSMRGGKGGFGSQLRAAGGKMSAAARRGEENRDSCRDLNGRRLSTIKQARELAAYIATQDERQRAVDEAQKKKLAKLEKMLGRRPHSEQDFIEAAQKLDDQGDQLEGDRPPDDSHGAESSSKAQSNDRGKKRERIEDSQYVEESRAIVDNVRSAVASAMLKKKRKTAVNSTKRKSVDPIASS